MSELQRVGRLPVFVDEEQIRAAYTAAETVVEALYAAGRLDVGSGQVVNGTLRRIAREVADAALRAAATVEDSGDISELPGVFVQHP